MRCQKAIHKNKLLRLVIRFISACVSDICMSVWEVNISEERLKVKSCMKMRRNKEGHSERSERIGTGHVHVWEGVTGAAESQLR